jgi:hypothetical protein
VELILKVESLINIIFTEAEVRVALISLLETEMNLEDPKSLDFLRKKKILDHLNNTYTRVEVNDGKFYLMADGIASEEKF